MLGSSNHTCSESSGSAMNKLSVHDKKSGRSAICQSQTNDDSVIMLQTRIKELEDQLETNGVPVKVTLFNHYNISPR